MNEAEAPKKVPTKQKLPFSVQRLAYSLIILSILLYFIIAAKTILIPITFSVFLAFMLAPSCNFFYKYIPVDFVSVLMSFLVVLIPLSAVLLLFSLQVADVFSDLSSISDNLKKGINAIMEWINIQVRKTDIVNDTWINKNLNGLIDFGIEFIRNGLSSAPQLMISVMLTFLYTFFILYYRRGLKNFFISQFHPTIQDDVKATCNKVQKLAQKYLYGVGLVMILMGVLNSIGLFLIGIQYPMLWGFLAALLTIIPYIGTTLGGLIPLLYAAATTGTYWQPFAVFVYYALIQFIEGNLITPKIVGNSVSINAMTAILSIIIGGYLWGIAGVVLALLLAATIRIIFSEIDYLKPLALLMSNDLYQKEDKFQEVYNKERFRLSNFFKISPFIKKKP